MNKLTTRIFCGVNIKNHRIGKKEKKGKDSPRWVGDNISLNGLHVRMRKLIVKPLICQICGINGATDLHNIDRKYTMDISTWIYLCRSCHSKVHSKINLAEKQLSAS